MQRRAFTLIELLVVIAIIAILAAILFPVFAQAKAAAKGTAALSNAKNLATGSLLYMADADDRVVPATSWNNGSDPIQTITGQSHATWVWLLLPYLKSDALTNDPLGPARLRFNGIPDAVTESVRPSYGYNQVYLSYWDGTGAGSRTVSDSQVGSPAGTILFTSKFHPRELGGHAATSPFANIYYYHQYGVAGVDQGPNLFTIVYPPCWDEAEFPLANSWGDGYHPYNAVRPVEAGAITGGVSFRRAGRGTFAFLDGHVQSLSVGQAAVGSTFTMTPVIDEETGEGPMPVITDRAKYLWDLE